MAGQFLGEVFLEWAGFEKRQEDDTSSGRRPDFRVSVFITGQRGRRTDDADDALWDAALILPEISGIPAVAPHYSAPSVGGRAKRESERAR